MKATFINRNGRGNLCIFTIELIDGDKPGTYIVLCKRGLYGGQMKLDSTIIVDKGRRGRTIKEQLEVCTKRIATRLKDKGYKQIKGNIEDIPFETLEEIVGQVRSRQFGITKPMLPKQFNKVLRLEVLDEHEWLASRKIAGIRCLMYRDRGEVYTLSKSGKSLDFPTEHLRKHPVTKEIFVKYPTLILDGELYKHKISLRTLSGWTKTKNKKDCIKLEYYIYDCIFLDQPELTASERIDFLQKLSKELNFTYNIKQKWNEGDLKFQFVPYVTVQGQYNITKLYNEYISEGFDGIVLRDSVGVYSQGRTGDKAIEIRKYPDFDVKVVGYRNKEDLVFICELEDGRKISVPTIANSAMKQEYINNFESVYKDRFAEITFDTINKNGIPINPRLRHFRFDI